MSDLIYRQDAIDAIYTIREKIWEIDIPSPTVPEYIEHHKQMQELMKQCDSLVKNITLLPSAERKGHWIEEDDYEYGENVWRCSVCGEPYVLIEGTPKQNQYYFCPNCGADMQPDNVPLADDDSIYG